MKINKEQKDFLKKNKISINKIFDCKDYSTAIYNEFSC